MREVFYHVKMSLFNLFYYPLRGSNPQETFVAWFPETKVFFVLTCTDTRHTLHTMKPVLVFGDIKYFIFTRDIVSHRRLFFMPEIIFLLRTA